MSTVQQLLSGLMGLAKSASKCHSTILTVTLISNSENIRHFSQKQNLSIENLLACIKRRKIMKVICRF